MAKIRDTATTIYAAATTASMVMDMPVHESGDLLVAFVGKDASGTFTTPSGWTAIRTSTSTGAGGGIYAKRATSSSETVTFALTADTCLGTIVSIRDVYGTTVADAIPTSVAYGTEDSTLPFAGVGITTANDKSMVFSHRFSDTTTGTSHLPPWINLFVGDAANGGSTVAYSYVPTAGVVTAPDMWAGGTDDGKSSMIEVRDGSSGTVIPAYLPLSTVPSVLISPLVGTTGAIDRGTYVAAASIAITSVAGKTVSGVTVAATADSGYNAFRGSMRNAGVSSVTNLNHVELDLTATQDVTTGNLIFGTYLHLAPRDYLDSGNVARGGKYILLGSSSANWRAWVVGGQFSKTDLSDGRNNYLIEPSYSTSEYASAGTPDYAALDYLAFGSSGYYGAPSILWNELWELRTVNVAGGSATNPFNFDDLVYAVNNGCGYIPLIQQAGSLGTVWIPIQVGGIEATNVSCNLRTFQWPTQANPSLGYVNFHVSNDKLGMEFYGLGSGDSIAFTNCLFTSDSSYYWRFNASHSASTPIDFSGSTVVRANVTLRSSSPLDSVSFISCTSFTQNNAALSNCKFTNTTILSDNLEDLSYCDFTSGGSGHAIELSATGTYAFVGNTFSGYGADSTTDACIYNNSGGAVTINVSGGGDTPTIRNGAGASTTVNNNITITITGLQNPSEVRVFDAGTTTERSGTGAENVTSGSHAFSVPASTSVDISILSLGYQNLRILAYSSGVDASIPVSQVIDRQYLNP